MKQKLFSVLLSLICSGVLLAQNCGTSEAMHEHYEKHPESKKAADAFEKQMRLSSPNRLRTSATCEEYIIPVVFHVFENNGSTVVPPAQIQRALDWAEADFKGLQTDFNTVDPFFNGRKATLNVRFVLAKIDPNGQPTTGINYYPRKSGFGNGGNAEVANYAWDNYKYMNIYIMEDLYGNGTTNNSGVCWYPDVQMSNAKTARMVYNYRYLGYGFPSNWGTAEFSSTFAHEFGHFLNLIHTFGENPDGVSCSGTGDNVDDTPWTNKSGAGCTGSVCGAKINGENFMDYNSTCYKMFTSGQVARMKAALQHPARKSLWQTSNLIATGVYDQVTCTSTEKLIAYSITEFKENNLLNDGSVTNSNAANLTLKNVKLVKKSGNLVSGTDFTVTGVPAGMTFTIEVITDSTAKITLTAKATNHEAINSGNINLNITSTALVGGSANVTGISTTFKTTFLNAYKIIITNTDPNTIYANATKTWSNFLVAPNTYFGLWFYNNSLKIEAYTNQLVSETIGYNAKLIAASTEVGPNSTVWKAYDAFPNQHTVYSTSFTSWIGKEAYIGFRIANSDGTFNYGWLLVTITTDGSKISLKQIGYNEAPNQLVITGSSIVNPVCTASITTTTPTTFCAGGSVVLTASAGSSYVWKNGNTILSTTTQNLTANITGSYTVEVTNANGCKATSSSSNVIVNSLPNASISTTTPTTFCTGGNVVLAASAGSSFVWKNGNTILSTTTQSLTANATGSYTVEVTNTNGCKATSSASNVLVNSLPNASISTTTPTTFCAGGNVVLTASAGSSFVWKNGNTILSTTTQSLTANATGSYTVEVTNANGCKATSSASNVLVNSLPNASISTITPTTFCAGGNVVLTASAGSSYVWKNGNTLLSTTTQSLTANATGSYTVEVTNANGCKATSSASNVLVNSLPNASISTTTSTTFCDGDSVVLKASSGNAYVWKNANSILANTTQNLTAKVAGSYTVEVTSPNGCKATSAALSVTIKAPVNCITQDIDISIPIITAQPNPFSDALYINLDKEMEFKLFDAYGKMILSGQESTFIETTKFSEGMYYLVINERKISLKLVKIN